jgi:hypothetical protein
MAEDRTAEFLPVTVRTEDPLGPGDGRLVRGRVVPRDCGVGIDDGPVDDVSGHRGSDPVEELLAKKRAMPAW